ncbi:hypothetical protein POTOM_021113 [Populus tomentosa]|uniref:Uncharacterized protein n=1 Tax=Populus tomentosa TaxID=118781 RepID=A0A8X8CS79_POPTO|nr:hypothetical protein POTOM_021113 [Populus tomentosa]
MLQFVRGFYACRGSCFSNQLQTRMILRTNPMLFLGAAFYLHAALLRQAFAHCGKFPTAASRRSLGRVSVPVWLIILSTHFLILFVRGMRKCVERRVGAWNEQCSSIALFSLLYCS